MPGVYRLDLPDAVCATGVPSVVVMLKGATNMSPVVLEIQLTDFDLNSTSNAVGAAASVTAGVTLADDAITSAKFDESTAFPLKSADTGATALARTGADSDTLETLSDEIATIDANVDAILADTGTDGVKVASLANDSITAAALKADAVTEIQSGLALEATLTAIKGAGWSNQTLVKIVTDIAAISAGSGATAQEVWEYVSRTLTQTATSITSSVSGSTITDVRGDSWDIDITDLTLDSNKQQFAIKRHAGDADSAALLLVDSDTGLLYINGAAGTAGDASLSYAGTTLTLTVKPAATAQLPSGNHVYGIQSVTAAGVVNEAYGGTFTVQADVVKATS
jgi:hypothetical protein